jgi:hypothetical protein
MRKAWLASVLLAAAIAGLNSNGALVTVAEGTGGHTNVAHHPTVVLADGAHEANSEKIKR